MKIYSGYIYDRLDGSFTLGVSETSRAERDYPSYAIYSCSRASSNCDTHGTYRICQYLCLSNLCHNYPWDYNYDNELSRNLWAKDAEV